MNKQELFFFVICCKPFWYYNVGKQDCFVINWGKGCLCDCFLWLITDLYDKSQKRPKFVTKKCQEIPLSFTLSTQHSVSESVLEQCSYKDDFSSLQIVKFALERTILGVFWFLKIILSLELQSPRGLPFLSCCVSSDLTGRQLASNRNSLPNKGQQSCDTVPLSSFFSISKFEWSRYQFVPLEYLACLL